MAGVGAGYAEVRIMRLGHPRWFMMPALHQNSNTAPQEPQDDAAQELWTLLRQIWAHKWLVLLAAVLCTALSLFWSVRQRKIYEADCTVEYIPNPPRPLGQKIEDTSNPVSYWSDREYFATQNLIIASRTVALRVAEKLGLHRDQDFMSEAELEGGEGAVATVGDAAKRLREVSEVTPERNTRLVHVTVEDWKPERAALLANTLAEEYIEKSVEDRLGSTSSALEWLGGQLDGLKKELEQTELALHEFKERNQALSISLEDRQNIVAADIQRYSESLTEARTRRIELEARLRALQEANDQDPLEVHAAAIDASPAVERLRETYVQVLAQRDALATEYGEAHPKMQVLSAQLATIRAQLRSEINGVIRRASVDLAEMETVERGLESALSEANGAGMELNLQEIEYRRLARQRDNTAELYSTILERTAQTDLTRALKLEYAQVVDAAVAPDRPIKPRLVVNVLLGLLGGLVFGCLAAIVLARMDRTVRTAEGVEGLGLTVLGLLPQIEQADGGGLASLRLRRRGATHESTGHSERRDLYVHHNPKSAVAECCRTVRTNLTFAAAEQQHEALLVTSASPREGKTTVTLCLAISLAQSGRRVLVVDTDLRKPRIHRSFGLRSSPGVTSLLVGDQKLEEVVQETQVPGLFLLSSGPIPPNPSELLLTRQFADLVTSCREQFDLVLLDSPPLSAVTDAAIIASQVDGTIVVVDAQKTSRDALGSSLRQLRDVQAHLVGGVLNDVDLSSQRYGQGSYYYYRRGEGYYAERESLTDAAES